MKVTRPFNLKDHLADRFIPVVESHGYEVDIVYINFEPREGEKPVLCVAHLPEGKASAWVTEDGKLNFDDETPALFFEEEAEPKQKSGWRPAKP